jgi:CheY-like chemotaxis protein
MALQNFKSGLYQLLVLDIKMPIIDSIELFNRIEKEGSSLLFSQHQSSLPLFIKNRSAIC